MATVLIAGGTGMTGRALTKALLDKGYDIIILTRDPRKKEMATSRLRYAHWDLTRQWIDPGAITAADHIIHVAGTGVADKRWTRRRKKEILESRVKSSELLLKGLRENPHTCQTLISASAIGWYGPDPLPGEVQGGFTEEAPPATDFLGSTCRLWEQSINPVTDLGIRLVKLRTGAILSHEEGALPEFDKPLRFGIGAILGTGKQVISWIHLDDLARLYLWAIEHKEIAGVYNAVAPGPVSNKELVLQWSKLRRGRFFIPIYVPTFLLKLLFGELSIEVLKSATVSSAKIREAGFVFQFPTITAALENLRGAFRA